uniref:Uncharacterized protein n=1 Tax=Oncorhynchus kisutch TaxID=8019 RepID=A0A8C7DJR2_ONCKI
MWRLYTRSGCLICCLGGTAVAGHDAEQVEMMIPVKDSVTKVTYNSDKHTSMKWNRPQQSEIYSTNQILIVCCVTIQVNPTNKPVIWISTYNAVPFEAGQYFNKVQVLMNM